MSAVEFTCSTCRAVFRTEATACAFRISGGSCGRLLCETCSLRMTNLPNALCSGHFYFAERFGIDADRASVTLFREWMRVTSPPPLPLLVYSSGSGSHHADSPACVGIVVADARGEILCEQSQYVRDAGATEAGAIAISRALTLIADFRTRGAVILHASDVNSIRRVAPSWGRSGRVSEVMSRHGVDISHVKTRSGVAGNELSYWLARRARVDHLTKRGYFDGKPWSHCTREYCCNQYPECGHYLLPRPVDDLRLILRPYRERFPHR